jgi:hypothetical protein
MIYPVVEQCGRSFGCTLVLVETAERVGDQDKENVTRPSSPSVIYKTYSWDAMMMILQRRGYG